MPGTIKIMDRFGEVVCSLHFRSPAQLESIKCVWKKVYGKMYSEDRVIVQFDEQKKPGPKPKEKAYHIIRK